MEIVTRKYFEEYLNLFDQIINCEPSDLSRILKIRDEFNILSTKAKSYKILELEEIPQATSLKTLEDLSNERLALILVIYRIIVDNLFDSIHKTKFDKKSSYGQDLWFSLLKLNFEDYRLLYKRSTIFQENTLNSSVKYSYLDISSPKEFKLLKNKIKKPPKKNKNEPIIDKDLFKKIQTTINTNVLNYNRYIEDNYALIGNQFSYYKKDIRFYLLDAPSGGNKTFKLLSYYNKNLLKVKTCDKLITFAGRLLNLEEIEKDLCANMLGVFDEKYLNVIKNIFSLTSIHHELVNIFIRLADEKVLFDFVIFLFEINKLSIQSINLKTNEISIINQTGNFLKFALILSKSIDIEEIKTKSKEVINFIFLSPPDSTITKLIGKERISYIKQYMDFQYFHSAIHYYIKDKIKHIKKPSSTDFKAEEYAKMLNRCKRGREDWNKYENICIEIFEYLFSDYFRTYLADKQSNTEDNLFRRDLIVNNLPVSNESFWSDIKKEFNANICIIEFKNYAEPLNPTTLYNTTKYTNSSIGKFILIFSRVGLNDSAKKLQTKLLRDHKILILTLDDSDIIGMLNEKKLGIDFSYRLENLKFNLLKNV